MHYFEYTNSKIFSRVTPPNPLRLLGPKSRAFGARSFSHAFFFSTLGSYDWGSSQKVRLPDFLLCTHQFVYRKKNYS